MNATKPNDDDAASMPQGAMEKQLSEWGRALDELRANADRIGTEALEDLERRYEDVRQRASSLSASSPDDDGELSDKAAAMRDSIISSTAALTEQATATMQTIGAKVGEQTEQAKASLDDALRTAAEKNADSIETARGMGEAMKEGGEDIRAGFGLAWTALRDAFDSAATRLKDQKRDD